MFHHEIDKLEVDTEVLKVESKARSDEIDKLEVESKARSDEIEVLKVLKRERQERDLWSRATRCLRILKDLKVAFHVREVSKGKIPWASIHSTHYLQMWRPMVGDPTALLEYCPKNYDDDSRAVLCAMIHMAREFLQQGLPEVRRSG